MSNQPLNRFIGTLFIMPLLSHAEPLKVLFDNGKAVPLHPEIQSTATLKSSLDVPFYPLEQPFPILSPALRVGKVLRRKLQTPPGFMPIFVLGSDKTSVRWLKVRKSALLKLGAIGILAEVKNKAQLNDMQTLASPLTLVAASADDLRHSLQIHHYPLVIADRALWQ